MLFKAVQVERGALNTFWCVTSAMFFRDCKQKFGAYKLGVFWGVLEPVVHVIIFTLILSYSVASPQEVYEIPYFVMSGLIPFFLFRNSAKSVMGACKSNRASFFFPVITPLHAVCSKALYEVFIYLLGFATIFLFLNYLGYGLGAPFNAVIATGVFFLITFSGVGVGLVLMVLREFIPSSEKWVNLFFRPLYFMSAVFYSVERIPDDLLFIFHYNPCVHAIEFMRNAVLGDDLFIAEWSFLMLFALFSNLLGFILFVAYKDKLRS